MVKRSDLASHNSSCHDITCHGVDPKMFLGYADPNSQMAEMLEKWQCVVCEGIPYPDEVVQCSNCDSLICSTKSIELKTTCPNCEMVDKANTKNRGFSCQKIQNRLITDFMANLKVKCQFCSRVLKLDNYKNHLRMQHTQLTCTILNCNEPIDSGIHCKKASCLIISKWLDVLKDNNNNINSLDDKTIKTIE